MNLNVGTTAPEVWTVTPTAGYVMKFTEVVDYLFRISHFKSNVYGFEVDQAGSEAVFHHIYDFFIEKPIKYC